MKRNQIAQEKFIQLREQAEKILASGNYVELRDSHESPLKLIDELQTMQIELEMQIDELHQFQEELIIAKDDYTELYELAPVGYMTTNAKGTILMANKTLASMLSIPRDELINKPVFNHIVYEDQDIYYLYLKKLADVKQTHVCEMRMQKKDGTTFYVQLESTIISDDSGKTERYRIVVIDLTERKRSEGLIQNSEGRLKALSEAIFEAIFFFINGTCIDQNQTAEKMFGYSQSEIFGKNVEQWVLPEDRNRLQRNILSNNGKLFKMTALRRDGTTFPSEIQVRTVSRNGNLILIVALRDISERKPIEDALLIKEDIINSLSSGIATCDLDGNLIYGNTSFLENWGFKDPKEFLGEPVWKFWQVEDRFNEIKQSLENKGKWSSELKAVRKNGTMFDAYISIDSIFDHIGKPIGFSATAIDITEKKAIEKQLNQEKKMESIGIIAGGIAHEFNNLLYIILGNTELSLEKIPESNPVHQNLQTTISACNKASGIVKQLLNFSRKTDQKLRLIKAVTVIEDTIFFLRSIIPRPIEFHKKIPKSNVMIFADPTQINQALMNIFINAANAMEETGGSLKINVGQTTVEENPSNTLELSAGNYLIISISDTGPGIPPEEIDKIFDPYYTTKATGKGAGMGLAVVHGIIKNHSGIITVESQLKKGTTFNIYIPVFGETPEIEAKPTEKRSHGSETFLFGDGEEAIDPPLKNCN